MPLPLVPSGDDNLDTGWGVVPVDPAGISTPANPVTPEQTAAVTQATQTANEVQRAAAAVSQLGPPPFGVPFVAQGGFVSQAWQPWITKLYRRIGSADSLTPDELSLLDAFSGGLGGPSVTSLQPDLLDAFAQMPGTSPNEAARLLEAFPSQPRAIQGLLESLYLLLDGGAPQAERVVWNDWNLVRDFTPLAGAGVPPRNAFQGNIVKDQFGINDAIQWQSIEALHDWKEGTDFEAHVHWALGSANDLTVRGVKWEIEWTACNPLESGVAPTAFPATTIQSAEFSVSASQPDRTHRVGTIFVIPAGTLKIGAHLLVRLKRIAAAATAPAADPFLISFGVHYQSDSRGSRSTFFK